MLQDAWQRFQKSDHHNGMEGRKEDEEDKRLVSRNARSLWDPHKNYIAEQSN